MSTTQLISYSQVTFINELWKELGHETQFFYDKGRDIYIFRRQYSVFLIDKQSLTKITRIRIPYDGYIASMNAHQDLKYVVYQTAHNQINIFSSRVNRQSIFKLSLPDKLQSIFHYEWIYAAKGSVDFIIVETSGVHLFKIDDEKNSLKEVKFFALKISCCWFEPKNQTLLTTNYLQAGSMQTFFFNERRRDFKYKGPEFCLDEIPQTPVASTLSSIFGSKMPTKQPFVQSFPFNPPGDKKNQDLSIQEKQLEQPHRIYLANLYSKTYLLYSDSSTGKIVFYYLNFEKIVKQSFWLTFPSDIRVNLSIVDNLIILSAVNDRISMVFDIKKQKPDSPLGPPQAIEVQQETQRVIHKADNNETKLNNESTTQTIIRSDAMIEEPLIQDEQQTDEQEQYLQDNEDDNNKFIPDEKLATSVLLPATIKPDQEIYMGKMVQSQRQESTIDNDVQFRYDFEGFFQDLRDSDKDKRLRDQYVVKMKWSIKSINSDSVLDSETKKPTDIYEKSCNYLEDDLILDVQGRTLHQFQVNLLFLPKLLEDDLESFLALLRRSHCKQNVFDYLKDLVHKHKQIMTFSLLYKHIFEIFSRAIQERNQKQDQSLDIAAEKLKNGYTILYPADFLNNFFQPLSEDGLKVNRTYLVELLVEFIRQFIENLKIHSVQVPTQIQNLLIKILVKENRLSYIHFLLQYQILSDSVEFAKLLIEISSKESLETKKLLGKYQVYEPAFQLGVDMLHRLEKYDEMLDIFLRRGLVLFFVTITTQFQEASYLLRKYSIKNKINLQQVIEGCNYPSNTFTKQEVLNYFQDVKMYAANIQIFYKSKVVKLSFTPEDLRTELYK